MPHMAQNLPKKFIQDLKTADLCLHAGDVVESNVLDEIAKYCPVHVVAGNMDSVKIRNKYPTKLVMELENIKIGLTHGSGSAHDLLDRVLESFSDNDIDVCVYGHSHKVYEEFVGEIFCINPGSLCDYLYAEFNSYAILEIEGEKFKHQIVKLDI